MTPDKSSLKKTLISRYLLSIAVLCFFFFMPAGTFKFWHAWVYLGILFIPVAIVMIYFFKKNPEFLERRMRYREKEKEQRKLLKYSFLIFFIGLLIPGLDFRYFWSTVPLFLVVLSDLIILVAYIHVFYVFKINQYASRIVEIEENQQVITTGPYAWVRHPMYTGVILLYLFTPLALGSFWGLIPFLILPVIIIFRIKNEEEVLKKELPGYEAYCRNTKYRLIPYVW